MLDSFSGFLKAEFAKRQSERRRYTIRAFAHELDVEPTVMWRLLKKNRHPSLNTIRKILGRLEVSSAEQDQLIKKLLRAPTARASKPRILETRFESVLSMWECFAILALMDLERFRSDPKWIASRLGSTRTRVNHAIQLLKQAELLSEVDGRFRKSETNLSTSEDVPSAVIQRCNLEHLRMAQRAMRRCSIERRDYSGVTLSIDSSLLSQAKEIIRRTREELVALSVRGSPDAVYRVNIQFFPLGEKP